MISIDYFFDRLFYKIQTMQYSSQNQPPRFIPLGGHPKKETSHRSSYQSSVPSEPRQVSLNSPVAKPPPILIRYIDPRLAHLFKDLQALSLQCQQLVTQETPNTIQKQEEIEVIMQSTKKIAEQMNEIMGQEAESVSMALIDNPSHTQESEEVNRGPTIGQLTTMHTQPSRQQELEAENEELRSQLLDTLEKNLRLQAENSSLRQQLEGERGERGELINSLSFQLQKLKNNSSLKTNASYTEQA